MIGSKDMQDAGFVDSYLGFNYAIKDFVLFFSLLCLWF